MFAKIVMDIPGCFCFIGFFVLNFSHFHCSFFGNGSNIFVKWVGNY